MSLQHETSPPARGVEMHRVLSHTRICMATIASATFSAPAWQRVFARARPALPLSLLLHGLFIYSVSRMGWLASERPVAELLPVVWVTDWRPVEAEPEPVSAPVEALVPVEPRVASPEARTAPSNEPAADAPVPAPRVEPEARVDAPATSEPRPGPLAPTVDWEKERRIAISMMLEERSLEEGYRTFSLDDVPEDDHGVEEPSPPTAIAEAIENPCAIVSGRLERFAMMMIGRCVREARGDLFADIKPSYLTMRPICAESVPEQPVLAAERSREFPTVKCRLASPAE